MKNIYLYLKKVTVHLLAKNIGFYILPLLFFTSHLKAQNCTTQDSLVLIELYNSSTGLNWDLSLPISNWEGITLDSNGCVLRIRLEGLITSGTIPIVLADLPHLIELELESCNLTGNIPPSLSQLHQLEELDLENNNLTGTIPASFANMPKLTELVLINNQLEGCYMPQLLPLCAISNANNQISDGNNFNGSWFDFCSSQANQCHSCREQDSITLRTFFSNFKDVTYDFSGPLDSWRGISLNENDCISKIVITDCCIRQGRLSPEIGNFSELEFLDLYENGIFGVIPPEIGNLTELEFLLLDENRLTGTIPPEIGNLTKLKYLYLHLNRLTGPIPSELGNLTQLVNLLLRNNQLSGSIPNSFANLTHLEILHFSSNMLEGCYDDTLSILCDIIEPSIKFMSYSNNFSASWPDFCTTGAGTCLEGCTDTLSANYNPQATISINSCVYDNFSCFAVSELNAAPNVLFNLNNQTQEWTDVGITGTSTLEAMAFDQSTGVLYGFDDSTFGRISTETAQFYPIGNLGPANGELGMINLIDIDGLSYDPTTESMYATARRFGSNDLLFVVDLETGGVMSNAMKDSNGNPSDYALIEKIFIQEAAGDALDVDDIAINPQTGQLFATHYAVQFGVISIIDKSNGSIDQIIYDVSNKDIEGLAFTRNNDLVGTAGNDALLNPNSYILIDYLNQSDTLLGPIDPNENYKDFECIDCYQYLTLGCLDTLTVNHLISIDQDKHAKLTIISDAEINQGATRFDAGQCVELRPHFEVRINAIFLAEIGGCQ